MKKFFLLSLLLTTSAFAKKECSVFEIQGWVRQKGYELHLLMAEKTMSEKSFPTYMEEEPKFSPYVNQFVVVRAEVEGKELTNKTRLEKILEIKRGVPDPLNQNASTVSKFKQKTKCSR